MANRRSMYWMSFSEGSSTTAVSAGGESRLLMPSIRESELGREFERYTVTRILFNLSLTSATANLVVTAGIHIIQEDVPITAISPADDPHSDWLWKEEFIVTGQDAAGVSLVHRDIRSQRKAVPDSEFYFVINNRSGATVDVHRSGRALIKRA